MKSKKNEFYTTTPKNCVCQNWDRDKPYRATPNRHHGHCRMPEQHAAVGRTPAQAFVHLGPPMSR